MIQIFTNTWNHDLKKVFISPGRVIGLDLGRSRVGIAVSDEHKNISIPLITLDINSYKDLLSGLKNELKRYNQVCIIIIGYPLSIDGKTNKMTQAVRDIAHKLAKDLNLDILLFDERLSTKAITNVNPKAINGKTQSSKKQAFKRLGVSNEAIDHLSATFILQGALDWLHSKNRLTNNPLDA